MPKPNSDRPVTLLAGGNPQIARGDGDGPVQDYIAALPGWKSGVAAKIDALIVKTVPEVQKAVKWNSPMYGLPDQGFFLGMHAFNKYLKINFFEGASLKPLPPGPSKDAHIRYLDIYEDDGVDEKQFVDWVKQAAKLPGFLGKK